jgi:low affinity Fe/Cu permease
VSDEVRSKGFFDRFASSTDERVSSAPAFAVAVAFVGIWAILLPFQGINNSVWHLWLNSPTTAATFLLVTVEANTARRNNAALHHKLDASLEAMAQVLDNTDGVDESGELAHRLREIAGVEMEASK